MNTLGSGQLCRWYSLSEILIATQNFDDGLVVGRGGFGKVYKGHIGSEESGKTVVAIKRLYLMPDQGAPEFRAEIEMLSKLRHSHLVSLLGFCDEGKEMILVYDYMLHGTVDHHLHNSNTPLSWMQRLKISIGAARGLDYLHTGAGTQHGVIHRDVKSSNILLDENWAAKISDFGLAKISPTNQPSSYVNTGIKGTFGYLDPEFFMTGKLTRKTDVFAFGVVLFELLSGRHAVDTTFPEEEWSLARWAQKCVKRGQLDQMVSAEIKGQLSPKSLEEFAQIANRCLHSSPKERPIMSEVVVALHLSQTLQEKFDNSAHPAGTSVFPWKITKYFVHPSKENSGLKIFSYNELKRATSNFQKPISTFSSRWVQNAWQGWVHEKTYAPSKLDVGLAITVKSLRFNPVWDLRVLGEFSHSNLVKLLGYCLEHKTLYLVHEFMEKRTLYDYLRKEDTAELSFIQRVKIAVGIARGLVFLLHKELIVYNWKLATNYIWLDEDFNVKLHGFDVAHMVNDVFDGMWPGLRKCNARGLGMLLMEILTGKRVPCGRALRRVERELFSGAIMEVSNEMIENALNPQMKLNAPQINTAHELFVLIGKCTSHPLPMNRVLEELEQLCSRLIES